MNPQSRRRLHGTRPRFLRWSAPSDVVLPIPDPRSEINCTANPPPTSKKRPRAVPSGRTHDPSTTSCCTRDWANLGGDGPTGLIAELVLTGDVADYARFRAVCRAWRRCSPEPHSSRGGALDSRFFPRRWIMLDKAFPDTRRHRFLNVSTGECIRVDLPELDNQQNTLLAVTPEGLLLLLHEPTLVVRLLNPLLRQLIDLPPVTSLLPPELKGDDCEIGDDLGLYGVGVTGDSTVAFCFSFPTVLAVAKPGDYHWTVVCRKYLDSRLQISSADH
ncbi:hypothetical protein EJB05_57196, partial [Eragrostis curvula]